MNHRPCPICGGKAEKFTDKFIICGQCEYIFLRDPADELSPEQQAVLFAEKWKDRPDGGSPQYHAIILSLAKSCGNPAPLALDYGCGNAGLVKELRASGVPTYGVDKVPPDDPFCFDGLDKLPNVKFDVISAVEVFEHLPNPEAILSEFAKRLAPEGFMVITTALTNRSLPTLRLFGSWIYQADPLHIGFLSETTMKYMAKKHGLDMQVLEYGVTVLSNTTKRSAYPVDGRWKFVFEK